MLERLASALPRGVRVSSTSFVKVESPWRRVAPRPPFFDDLTSEYLYQSPDRQNRFQSARVFDASSATVTLQSGMYRWIVISIIVLSSFFTTIFQVEMWPFSPFQMFASSISNSALNQLRSYELIGLRDGEKAIRVESRVVTGFIHPGMVSVGVAKLIHEGNARCVQSMLDYWGARYLKLGTSVPAEYAGFQSLVVRERGSNKPEPEFKFDIKFDMNSHESN